jgi:hypothetical protein
MKLVRLAKWGIFLLGLAWAFFSGKAFMFLGRAFPSSGPENVNITYFLASLQAYLIVFAPLAIGLIFLLIKWPEKRSEPTNVVPINE